VKNGWRMCGFSAKQMKTKLIFIHLKLLMVVIGKLMYFDRQCYLLYNESNSKLITFGARTLANQNESINEPAHMIHIKVF